MSLYVAQGQSVFSSALDFRNKASTLTSPVSILCYFGILILTPVTEKRERDMQVAYGRACTLYPRSIELLEQLGVAEDLVQSSFVARASATFKNGKRVTGRGWNSIYDNISNTFHDYTLNIRQCHSEDILLQRYVKASENTVNYGWELVDFTVDTTQGDGYNVTAVVHRGGHGDKKTIRWYVYITSS